MSKWLVLVTVLLTLAFIFGCAPKAEPVPTPTPAPTPAPAVEQPKYGGVLNYPLRYLPKGYDTHRKTSYSPYVGIPIWNNLVRFDARVRSMDASNIIGDLAERWEISTDAKTFTFYLRQGVKWHDGMPFTADDVVYSLEKIGDSERSSVTGYMAGVESIEKVSDYIVKVNMENPNPAFLSQLVSGYSLIQAKHLADVDWRTTDFLVGTGPFKFKQIVSQVEIELERNPDYWKKDDAGNQLPYLDGIKIHVIKDRSAQIDAIATKKLDMTNPGFALYTAEHLDQVNKVAPGIVLDYQTRPYGNYLWFNLTHKPFDDIRVRKALSYMCIPEEVVLAGWGTSDLASYGRGIFPPWWGLPEDEINKIYEYRTWSLEKRVAEAKKLLAEAGYPDGFPIDFVSDDSEGAKRRTTYIADQFTRHLGMDVTMNVYDRSTIQEKLDGHNFDVYTKDTTTFIGDPNEYRDYFETGHALSDRYGISIPEGDKLWAEQASEKDPAKRKEIVQKIERLYLEEWVAMPFAHSKTAQVWWPYVKGYVPYDTSYQGTVALEYVWLDK